MSQNPNQFSQTPELGDLDLRFNPNTISCQVGPDVSTPLVPGQAVKMVDSVGGVPKVEAVTDDTDDILGFVVRNFKASSYEAGDAIEVASQLNCIHLEAQGAINRGQQVCIHSATVGHVKAPTSGDKLVGYAFDKAADGELLRVILSTPSFTLYS